MAALRSSWSSLSRRGAPVDAATLLVEAGAATAWPLVSAAGCNSAAVVEFLLDQGADIDGDGSWTPLDEALYWANRDIASLLVGRGAKVRALSTAAGLGSISDVDRFFDHGRLSGHAGPIGSPFPDISDGLTDSNAAGWATYHGHPELLDLFS